MGKLSAFAMIAVGTILHAKGAYRRSTQVLDRLADAPNEQKLLASDYLGNDFDCLRLAWQFWNRIETLYVSGLSTDLLAANLLIDEYSGKPAGSISLLLLSIGVFNQMNGDLSGSSARLKQAYRYSKEHAPQWLPRICSALFICEHPLNDSAASARYLELAQAGLSQHFGPLGWKLRIARGLHLHSKTAEAIRLTETTLLEAHQKHEDGYHIWSHLHLAEFTGRPLPQNLARHLFRQAGTGGMSRAIIQLQDYV
jgi:hypothetical protein